MLNLDVNTERDLETVLVRLNPKSPFNTQIDTMLHVPSKSFVSEWTVAPGG